ncbi:hypothetical protein EDD16DRAFT_1791425 [Pisolithus croceorrhizus]|nr:hypothetical protein EDD16DRAFT_1791425 [Pisolithus croceorrhizus]
MSYFGGRRDNKQAARDAIVGLRQQLQMIEKKEEYLQKKIDEELKKAKANAVSNKAWLVAPQSQPKRCAERRLAKAEVDRLAGQRLQLEMQINTLGICQPERRNDASLEESIRRTLQVFMAICLFLASFVYSAATANDLFRTMDKVDATLSKIAEQREIATEIADAISGPIGAEVADEDELKAELEQLEQEHLDERLAGAEHVPVHVPAGARRVEERPRPAIEDDEDAQLRELQAALAM